MLKQLWRFLFGGHDHHWVVLDSKDYALTRMNYSAAVPVKEELTHFTKIISRCSICGELRSEEL